MTELEKILLQKAIKPTAMRLLVVEKLLKQQYAVSHKELAEQFEELHTHFYCTDCKHTFCLTETEIPNIEVPQNFKLDGANLVLKGKCDKCNK